MVETPKYLLFIFPYSTIQVLTKKQIFDIIFSYTGGKRLTYMQVGSFLCEYRVARVHAPGTKRLVRSAHLAGLSPSLPVPVVGTHLETDRIPCSTESLPRFAKRRSRLSRGANSGTHNESLLRRRVPKSVYS